MDNINSQKLLEKIAAISGSEIVGNTAKSSKIRVYCGYQVSSSLHIGHIAGIKILNSLARRSEFQVMVLAADLHMWMNKKRKPDQTLYSKMYQSFAKLLHPNIKVITGAFGRSGKLDGFQLESKYMLRVIELSNITTLARVSRALTADLKVKNKTVYLSNLLYPIMQIADIKELDIDVAISGMDQRKIHMLCRDSFKKINFKKPVLIHTPLLNNRGRKLSKSLNNGISIGDSICDLKTKLDKYSNSLKIQISKLINCNPTTESIAESFFNITHEQLYYKEIIG